MTELKCCPLTSVKGSHDRQHRADLYMRFRRGTTKEHPGKLTESQGPAWGDWAGPEWAGAVSQKRLGQEQNGGHFWARLWLSFKGPCPRGVTLWARKGS